MFDHEEFSKKLKKELDDFPNEALEETLREIDESEVCTKLIKAYVTGNFELMQKYASEAERKMKKHTRQIVRGGAVEELMRSIKNIRCIATKVLAKKDQLEKKKK
jgi:hypothetical protein